LQYLRQRFDATSAHSPNIENEYFNYTSSPSTSAKPWDPPILPEAKIVNSAVPILSSPFRTPSRHQVQAGDLHSTTGHPSDAFRPLTRSYSILNTPRVLRFSALVDECGTDNHETMDDFDLREEVMSCIAKSIGLLQPPYSGVESIEASPAFPASDSGQGSSGTFDSSFGSLSLLDIGDDNSSITAGSVNASYMSGLDNEVEILYFAAGSTLVKAGERNTGLCVSLLLCVVY
jgi:lysophospholipid hydrolase